MAAEMAAKMAAKGAKGPQKQLQKWLQKWLKIRMGFWIRLVLQIASECLYPRRSRPRASLSIKIGGRGRRKCEVDFFFSEA
jgi:hypothetical protein